MEYHLLEEEQEVATDPYLTPVYPTTEGLTQSVLRRLVTEALRHMREPGALPDLLPEGALGEQLLPTLPDPSPSGFSAALSLKSCVPNTACSSPSFLLARSNISPSKVLRVTSR